MNKQRFPIAVSIVAALSAAAYAHTGATGIVKERMDAMSVMSKAVNSIAQMMQGETPYDTDAVRQGAVLIKEHSGDAMTSQFPEGSLQKPSVAKPEIWSNWDEFVSLADRLGVLADGLEAAADNGPMMGGGGNAEGHMMGEGGSDIMGGGSMMGDRGSAMMGGDMMMGGRQTMMLDPDMLAQMPADGVFNMLAQTCSSCHTKFRIEKQ